MQSTNNVCFIVTIPKKGSGTPRNVPRLLGKESRGVERSGSQLVGGGEVTASLCREGKFRSSVSYRQCGKSAFIRIHPSCGNCLPFGCSMFVADRHNRQTRRNPHILLCRARPQWRAAWLARSPRRLRAWVCAPRCPHVMSARYRSVRSTAAAANAWRLDANANNADHKAWRQPTTCDQPSSASPRSYKRQTGR